VAAGQQADDGALDHAVLTDDYPLHLEQGVLQQGDDLLVAGSGRQRVVLAHLCFLIWRDTRFAAGGCERFDVAGRT